MVGWLTDRNVNALSVACAQHIIGGVTFQFKDLSSNCEGVAIMGVPFEICT